MASAVHAPARSQQAPGAPFSFQGMKIWVSILVPERIKVLIRKHNGIIARNESEADILIIDNKRPAGRTGYSHLWIEDCVRSGRRIDEEKYLIVPAQAPPRTQASQPAPSQALARSKRKPRNPFTPEEDKILIRWLEKEQALAAEAGAPFRDGGNAIYQKLAEAHPSHTYHSWRDRWLKVLCRVTALKEAPSQAQQSPTRARPRSSSKPPSQPNSPSTPRQPPARPQAAKPREAAPVRPAANSSGDQTAAVVPPAEPPAPAKNASAPSLFFMEKHHYYLIKRTYQHYLDAKKRGTAVSEADFFASLADEHPEITAEDWHDLYVQFKTWYEKAFLHDDDDDEVEADEVEADAAETSAPDVVEQAADKHGSDAAQAEAEAGRQQEAEEPAEDADLDLEDDAILDGVDSQDDKQQEFLNTLEVYNDTLGVYIPSSFFVGGRYLETFSLWMAVREQASSPTDVDWDKVIEYLGFDTAYHPSLKKQLAGWYEQNLQTLGVFLEEFMNQGDEVDEEEEEEEEEGEGGGEDAEQGEGAEENDEEPGSQLPAQQKSTGIFASAKKRLLSIAFPHSDAADRELLPSSPSKRVRFSNATAAEEHDDDDEDDEDDDDDDDDEFEPLRARSAAEETPAVEPETQDFAYGDEPSQPVDLDDDEAAGDEGGAASVGVETTTTPSQQLRTENVFVAATPLSLPARQSRSRLLAASQPAVQPPATTPRRTRQQVGASRLGHTGGKGQGAQGN